MGGPDFQRGVMRRKQQELKWLYLKHSLKCSLMSMGYSMVLIVYVIVYKNGMESDGHSWIIADNSRKQLTEAEAMAMIQKPEPRNRDEALAMLADDGQKLGMYGTPQPAKTRVRLFVPTVLNSSNRHNEVVVRDEPVNPNLWNEIHYDAETKQFYVEQQ